MTSKTMVQMAACSLLVAGVQAGDTWIDRAISPVSNPIFFEDPYIKTEIRPLFVQHDISDDFLGGALGDSSVRVYALQARFAVNDRLAIIATKDGYIDADFEKAPALSNDGWADIAAGVKYAIVKDEEHDFILTPGIKFELPTGNRKVFQGNGKGEWNAFLSGAKGWGNWRAMGTFGVRLPNDWDAESAQLHYSFQVDYFTCKYFIPFVGVNATTVLSEGNNALPLNVEGFDLINFGSPDAGGLTQAALGTGFRTVLADYAHLGFSYEHGIGRPRGLFEQRFTVDLIFRF